MIKKIQIELSLFILLLISVLFTNKFDLWVNNLFTKFNYGIGSVYLKDFPFQNSNIFNVPKDHYFFLGDNRDCSKDSRFLSSVGYVHKDNIVGKAQFIFFSSDKSIGSFFSFWKWNKSIRIDRFFKKIN